MRRFRIRRKWWPVTTILILAFLAAGQYYGWFGNSPVVDNIQPGLYKVTYVYDGDTIAVKTPSGEEKVRFIGVDTPETHDPRKPVQCYGPKASAYSKKTLTGQQVKLASDPLDTDRDRYGRLLRYVYLSDGTLYNERLIKLGYGFYYPYFTFSKKKQFAAAEKQAQASNLGLWAHCQPIPTDQGGYTSNPLAS